MIRFIFVLLIMHLSFLTLVSCTSSETTEISDAIDGGGAIDEADLSDAPIDESGEFASTDNVQGEDAVENEMEASDQAEAQTDQVVAQDENQSSDELSEDDLDGEIEDGVAENDDSLGNELDGELNDEPLVAANEEDPLSDLAVEPEPMQELAPEPEAPPTPVPVATVVRDIRYLSNAIGGSIVIETSRPVVYQTRMNPATQQFVIEIADVELPASLQRPYQLKEMNSQFGSINAYQGENSKTARVVIQLSKAGSGEPIIQQEGTSLVVLPPTPPLAPALAATPDLPEVSREKSEGPLAAKTLDEFLTGNHRFYGRAISLQVKEADVRDVINFVAEESGANIVMSDDVNGQISLKIRKIPWDQALVTVMRAKGLGYTRQGNVLRISTLGALQAETEATNKIILAQKAIIPNVVQVITASYANIDDLTKSVTPFLSKDGKVVADNRTNSLIVTDTAEIVERVSKLVKTLDIVPTQVSIESKIVEAVEGFENYVGVNWNMTGSPITLSSSGGAFGAPVSFTPRLSSTTTSDQFANGAPLSMRLGVGVLDGLGDLSASLSLAESNSLAKVITSPRISTMNREKSIITQIGENVSVITTRDPTTRDLTKSEKRTPYTIELAVTPQITADGGVIMDLDVSRQFLGPVVDAELKSQAINTRKAKTKVLVRNGQTAVIGGIYTSDESEATVGIPGLMKIPILGWLFKNRTINRAKNELLIFMTPRILSLDGTGVEANLTKQ